MIIYKEIESCRICKNQELDLILDLGTLPLTGVFPKTKSEEVPTGPLSLIKCRESNSKKSCGLVQLRESYNSELKLIDNKTILYGQEVYKQYVLPNDFLKGN